MEPNLWPPGSLVLTIMKFFFWEYLKQTVYSDILSNNEQILKNRITEVINSITHRMSNEEFRRVEFCVMEASGIIE